MYSEATRHHGFSLRSTPWHDGVRDTGEFDETQAYPLEQRHLTDIAEHGPKRLNQLVFNALEKTAGVSRLEGLTAEFLITPREDD